MSDISYLPDHVRVIWEEMGELRARIEKLEKKEKKTHPSQQ